MSSSPLKPADEQAAYAAAQCVVKMHQALSGWLRVGMTIDRIDAFVGETLASMDCRSCFLGYKVRPHPPFPSHACLSVNSCIVHGHVGSYAGPMKAGDVLKIDIGVWHHGWIGDAAWTYVFGHKTPEVERLTSCGKASIRAAMEVLTPRNRLFDWASTLQRFVEIDHGFHLIRRLGGHGIGRKLHCPPFIANTTPTFPGEWPEAQSFFKPGMILAVEPMIATGTSEYVSAGNAWPLATADGSMAVHYEHDVLITEDGHRVLTEGLDEVEDLITR